MHDSDEPAWVFDLCGDHLALDFANTVSNRFSAAPIERLPDYAALLVFAQQSGVLAEADAQRLGRWARRHRDEAEAIVAAVRDLREALYRVFLALAEQRVPAAEDLALFNRWIGRMGVGPSLDWEWADGPQAPAAPLLPIVVAAVDLLRSATRERVRVCDADTCMWLFLDTSKNRSRRWCDMKVCGNRMKSKRFHARSQAHKTGAGTPTALPQKAGKAPRSAARRA